MKIVSSLIFSAVFAWILRLWQCWRWLKSEISLLHSVISLPRQKQKEQHLAESIFALNSCKWNPDLMEKCWKDSSRTTWRRSSIAARQDDKNVAQEGFCDSSDFLLKDIRYFFLLQKTHTTAKWQWKAADLWVIISTKSVDWHSLHTRRLRDEKAFHCQMNDERGGGEHNSVNYGVPLSAHTQKTNDYVALNTFSIHYRCGEEREETTTVNSTMMIKDCHSRATRWAIIIHYSMNKSPPHQFRRTLNTTVNDISQKEERKPEMDQEQEGEKNIINISQCHRQVHGRGEGTVSPFSQFLWLIQPLWKIHFTAIKLLWSEIKLNLIKKK